MSRIVAFICYTKEGWNAQDWSRDGAKFAHPSSRYIHRLLLLRPAREKAEILGVNTGEGESKLDDCRGDLAQVFCHRLTGG